jgi:carboxypeptidase C (cathepsin A)
MRNPPALLLLVLFAAPPRPAGAAAVQGPAEAPSVAAKTACPGGEAPCPIFKPEEVESRGSVVAGGRSVSYDAHAGTLIVHPKDWDDVPQNARKDEKGKPKPSPEASMFYVAYFERGAGPARPLTFLFNGGPGSSSVWLHMGAFGPRRVVTADDTHTPAAPYHVVDNAESLLDVSDLVFVDAPGTGFSRVAGRGRRKAFFGVDQDANAFADFIVQFLSKYGRWNSPKYLFGESYGTTRSAVLARVLEDERMVDVNGVILLSQILNYADNPDGPEDNPGIELPYQLALPTYAATAWYHKKLPPEAPQDLTALLAEVERFAMGDYARALEAGADLPAKDRQEIAAKLHRYTGLPVDYILKANLRVSGGEFEKNLEGPSGATTGRLDSRFTGPDLDPLSKEAEYDPQAAAIGSAYVSAFNDYVRRVLKFGRDKLYKPELPLWESWDYLHQPPSAHKPLSQAANVMPDLAAAMKYNPGLKVMLNAGYFDLATPFFQGVYEMGHLPIPEKLRSNIEFKFYRSGHMVYAHASSLEALHDNVADFIRRTAKP